MNRMRLIRARLGVKQQDLAEALGCNQSNITRYERGQTIPPGVACRLISYAKSLGVRLTYNQIYGDEELPAPRMLPLRQLEKA